MYMYSTQLQGLDIASIPHGKNPLWKTVGTTIEIILSTESSLIFFYFSIFYPFVFQRKLSTNQQFLTIQEVATMLLATTDLFAFCMHCRYHCCIGATGVQLLICRYCVDTV